MSRIYVPECWTEQFLLYKILEITKSNIKKENNKPEVIKRIFKEAVSSLQIGIVDEDPGKTHSTKYHDFAELQRSDEFRLRLLKRKNTRHYLIEICPDFENWIIYLAKKAKIDSYKKYNIPRGDAYYLHDNSQENLPTNIEKFYVDVLTSQDEVVRQIKQWISGIEHKRL